MTKKGTIFLFLLVSWMAQGSQGDSNQKQLFPDPLFPPTNQSQTDDELNAQLKKIADSKLQIRLDQLEKTMTQKDEEINKLQITLQDEKDTWLKNTKLTSEIVDQLKNKNSSLEQDTQEKQEALDKIAASLATHAQTFDLLSKEKQILEKDFETLQNANKDALTSITHLTNSLSQSNDTNRTCLQTIQTLGLSLHRWKHGFAALAGVTIASILGNILLGYCHSHKCDTQESIPSTTPATPQIAQAADDEVSAAPVLPEEEPFAIQQDQETAGFETDADEQDEESFPQAIPTVSDVSEPQESELIAAA
jgi:hypothetical protein